MVDDEDGGTFGGVNLAGVDKGEGAGAYHIILFLFVEKEIVEGGGM